MSGTIMNDAIKAEILTQIGFGESVANVAKAYNVNEDQIYKFIMEARNRQRQQAPAPETKGSDFSTVPTSGQHITEQPKTAANSLDAQMDHLTKEFQIKLKEILKRQILNSISGV